MSCFTEVTQKILLICKTVGKMETDRLAWAAWTGVWPSGHCFLTHREDFAVAAESELRLIPVTGPFPFAALWPKWGHETLASFLHQLISSVGERRGAPEKKNNRELRIKRKNSDDLVSQSSLRNSRPTCRHTFGCLCVLNEVTYIEAQSTERRAGAQQLSC